MSNLAKNYDKPQPYQPKDEKKIPVFKKPGLTESVGSSIQQTEKAMQPFSEEQIERFKKKFNMYSASKEDLAFCLAIAKEYELDPLRNQIYFVSRRTKKENSDEWITKWEPMPSRDGLHSLAVRTGNFLGMVTKANLETSFKRVNGEWVEIKDLVATAVVRMKGQFSVVATEVSVCYNEYVQKTSKGEITKFWQEKPITMLKKVAESQALRKACDITGMYTVEEMGVGDVVDGQLQLDSNTIETVTETLESVFHNLGFQVTSSDQTFYLKGEIAGRSQVARLITQYGFTPLNGEENVYVSENAYDLVVSGAVISSENNVIETEATAIENGTDAVEDDVPDIHETPEDNGGSSESPKKEKNGSEAIPSSAAGGETQDNLGTDGNNEPKVYTMEEMKHELHKVGAVPEVVNTTEGVVLKVERDSYKFRSVCKVLGMLYCSNDKSKYWYKVFPY